MSDPQFSGKALRVFVEKGGCSGYSYGFTFDEKRDGDSEATFEGLAVVVDAESLPLLEGCVISYEGNGLVQGGFKISNPNAKGHCGCGSSFSA